MQRYSRGPRAEGRGPKAEDRFSHLKLQNEYLRQNALLDAKTLNSMGSSFCSFTRLKLQNEDPRWNVLFDAETFYLTLKHWNQWGLRFVVLPASNYKLLSRARKLRIDS